MPAAPLISVAGRVVPVIFTSAPPMARLKVLPLSVAAPTALAGEQFGGAHAESADAESAGAQGQTLDEATTPIEVKWSADS